MPNHPGSMRLPEQVFWVFSAGADHSDNPYDMGLAHFWVKLDISENSGGSSGAPLPMVGSGLDAFFFQPSP